MSEHYRVGDQVEMYEPLDLCPDGCPGFIYNVRFIEAKWFRLPMNKARKGVSRKAARKMRRKWYV